MTRRSFKTKKPVKKEKRKPVKEKAIEKKRKPQIWNEHHLIPKNRINEVRRVLERGLKRRLTCYEECALRKTKRILIHMHQAWNQVFNKGKTRCAWEAIMLVKRMAEEDLCSFKPNAFRDFTDSQYISWCTLFGQHANPREVIEIIRSFWSQPFPKNEMMVRLKTKPAK